MTRALGITPLRWIAAVVLSLSIVVGGAAQGQAVTDAQLKAAVQSEYPGVVNATDWNRVRMLREYSYRHTAYATSSDTDAHDAGLVNVLDVLYGLKTLGDGYRFFDEANGGQICGGTSVMLAELYALYGYPNWIIQIGWTAQFPSPSGSSFAHAQTIAAINHAGKTYRVVSDAVVNISYTASNGVPIDYYDLVWLLGQNQAGRITTSGPINGTATSPDTKTVGFYSDQPNDSIALGSHSVDPADYTITRTFDRWVYESPRTVARLEALGDVWWKPQLVTEGKPGQTIYLHAFPYDPDGVVSQWNPLVATSKDILAEFKKIGFGYRDGFGGVGGGAPINAVTLPMNARFSLANDPCTNTCGVGLYPVPTPATPESNLYFQPRQGVVAGQITFPVPVVTVDVDVTYFGGGTVTMTGYDGLGAVVGTSTATDQSGRNRLGVTAKTGKTIAKVVLSGSNGNTAVNIRNLQTRTSGPTMRFSYGEGFTAAGVGINTVAAGMNARFSLANDPCPNTCGVGLYPIPSPTAPDAPSLYFQPRGGVASGQITFTTPVSAVSLDVTYFAGGTVTLTAYDASWNVLDQTSGTDRPGQNHLAVTANPGHTAAIKHVRVQGVNGNVAINIKNVMQFTWGE